MKKFLLTVVAVFVAATASFAQRAYWQSFMPTEITSIQVSNTMIITNVSSFQSVGTNVVGTVYTNSGVKVTAAAGDATQLISDVFVRPTFLDWNAKYSNDTTNGNTLRPTQTMPATLVVKTKAGSGANAAVTFTITPVWDQEENLEATDANDSWIFSFTPTASATQILSTNVPLYRWPAVEKLRAVKIINADTDASSGVEILEFGISSYL